jgi:hypothetical protein
MRSGGQVSATVPSCFFTRMRVRTRLRSGQLLLRRASTTSHSAWIVSPAQGVIQSRFSAGRVVWRCVQLKGAQVAGVF